MTSLFMPFDMFYFYLLSSFIFISMVLLLSSFFKVGSLSLIFDGFVKSFTLFFLSLKPQMFNKASVLLFFSTFILIIFVNFFSVFSFNFPLSSQISSVFCVSLGIWFSLVIFSLVKNFSGFLSHLIPEGTPLPLTILLFLIELVSNIIRPLTLMVRLVANILAGHLMMSLLSSLVFLSPASSLLYVGLNMVELLVALIQSYIFTTMLVLYYSEV